MPAFRTLDDVPLENRRVVVRADLNVPVSETGAVGDTTRIERFAPTVQRLRERGAIVIVLSHFARPKGRVVPSMSLKPVAGALQALVGAPVAFVETDWRDARAGEAARAARPGEVLLMENTRFHPGEEANDPAFAKDLAALGDAFVADAFSVAHRAHASTEGIGHCLPAVAGLAMQAELEALQLALDAPERPVFALVGGSKVSSKLDLLGNLVERVDALVIGGGMANTFLAAQGAPIGASLAERDMLDTARDIRAKAGKVGCEILLPRDAVVAEKLEAGAAAREVAIDAVGERDMILDIGPASVADLEARLKDARTVLWNGPVGAFEVPPFDRGTTALARRVAALTREGLLRSIAGGGDTVAALNHAGVGADFTYVSTAGGAFLEWLEGKTLPGVEILRAESAPA